MRKTTEYKAENRLTVDIEGLMAMLYCGEVTAKKIADYAEARVIVGRRVLYNVDKIKKYLDEYSGAAEPPFRCGVSHLSRRNEPL